MNRRKKRQPADSATAVVAAMVNASLPPLAVPKHVKLRSGDRPFWDGVLRARARDEWTESDLVIGAQLARCQHDIEIEQAALYAEGTVVENQRGTMVMNARVTVLEQLARREMALMRALRMGGVIPTRDLNERRGVDRAAAKVRSEVETESGDEPLLA
jgi:hypothetical protein